MPLTIYDQTRIYPKADTPYLGVSQEDLFQQLIGLKRAYCPNWTDESPADFGMLLLHTTAVLADWLRVHMERVSRDLYIGTTQNREAMRLLCELLGYQLGEAAAASVVVTFTIETGHPELVIPKGTKVAARRRTDQRLIVFEVSQDTLVPTGTDLVDIVCSHGESISQEIVGSSDGSTGQRFALSRRPVVWQSESVEIFDGAAWTTWTRVGTFVDAGANPVYRILVDDNGSYWIVFGDGTNGKIPVRGEGNIRVSYRQGGGDIGNVGAAAITELLSSVTYVESVTNAKAASGGTDKETLENARLFGPASVRALDRAVNIEDLEFHADAYTSPTYGGIAKSKVIATASPTVRVMIVPRSGGVPPAGLKTELQEYLTEIFVVGKKVAVVDPSYFPIDITAEIFGLPGARSSEVLNTVRQKLVAFLSPAYQDPETGLYPRVLKQHIELSQIYGLIQNTSGVDHCTITAPAGNITIPPYQIADLGSLDLTLTISGQEYRYTSTR